MKIYPIEYTMWRDNFGNLKNQKCKCQQVWVDKLTDNQINKNYSDRKYFFCFEKKNLRDNIQYWWKCEKLLSCIVILTEFYNHFDLDACKFKMNKHLNMKS